MQWIKSHTSSTQNEVTVTLPVSYSSTKFACLINFYNTTSSEGITRRTVMAYASANNQVKYYSIKLAVSIVTIGF